MKSKLIVKCSCGKKWQDDNTPEAAKSWWDILGIVDPELVSYIERKGDEKTLELVLRLVWSRHNALQKERGDKDPHECTCKEEIIIESLEDLKNIKKGEKHG